MSGSSATASTCSSPSTRPSHCSSPSRAPVCRSRSDSRPWGSAVLTVLLGCEIRPATRRLGASRAGRGRGRADRRRDRMAGRPRGRLRQRPPVGSRRPWSFPPRSTPSAWRRASSRAPTSRSETIPRIRPSTSSPEAFARSSPACRSRSERWSRSRRAGEPSWWRAWWASPLSWCSCSCWVTTATIISLYEIAPVGSRRRHRPDRSVSSRSSPTSSCGPHRGSLGPGFALGSGSLVSPLGTQVGLLPALPVLGALPQDAPALGYAVAGRSRGDRLRRRRSTAAQADRGWSGRLCLGPRAVRPGSRRRRREHPRSLALWSGGAAGPGRLVDIGPDPAAVWLWSAAELGPSAVLGRHRGPHTTRSSSRTPDLADADGDARPVERTGSTPDANRL